ncbi:MAG: DUF7385 family protein [Halobacteriota archaeon]
MDEALDIHAIRHRLKLRRDTGTTALYENRDGVSCPVCEDAFDELFVTARRASSFRPDEQLGFCIVREDERLLVFTHE